MISIDKARALKEAGLKWEPKKFDLYTMAPTVIDSRTIHHGIYCTGRKLSDLAMAVMGDRIWLPSLSQLLTEIEKRRYFWELNYLAEIRIWTYGFEKYFESEDSLEDAAANALLWILRQKER